MTIGKNEQVPCKVMKTTRSNVYPLAVALVELAQDVPDGPSLTNDSV